MDTLVKSIEDRRQHRKGYKYNGFVPTLTDGGYNGELCVGDYRIKQRREWQIIALKFATP